MELVELFLRDHAIVHSLDVGEPEGRFSLEYNVLAGLTDEQLRLRPGGWNSIAWILWHITRGEDLAANVIVAERPQILDDGEWLPRLKITRRDFGTAMSDEDVEALSQAIDFSALRGYRQDVGRRTREVARGLPASEWERVIDARLIGTAAAQGAFGPGAEWVGQIWEGKSKGWFLYWVAASHSHMHLGQARWVKEMILKKRGR